MNRRRIPLVSPMLSLVVLAASSLAAAQNYPSRPIKLLVPLAAGSTADILSRVVGTEVAAATGQPVIV